ncbi:MAG: PglZ domain-containing protein [Bacteroidales bacterium]|nr:PglZ domain-containing protein [Bacteroidales bacterium]
MSNKVKILWADDEIELLKPHIIFLTSKGYDVITTNNGNDALEYLSKETVDIIFLDEQMPGMSGIETLESIKNINPLIPVVMITKSEEENLMENAIGSNIADYLIKPVNPNQILLCLKKNIDNKRLVSQKTTQNYQQAFLQIGMDLSNNHDFNDWAETYKTLTGWELRIEAAAEDSMYEVYLMQKSEANKLFCRFIENNYIDWLHDKSDNKPLMSHFILKDKVFPLLGEKPLFLFVIDNMRYDQWRIIEAIISDLYRVDNEVMFSSILPTTTQYARNALFAGLMPSEIQKKYPQYWLNEDEEGTKNQHEEFFLDENLKRCGKDKIKFSYNKVLNLQAGKKLVDNLPALLENDLNVIVYNFVDMLSHARTEMEIIKELADDDSAYRSLTKSWFEHSALYEMIEYLASKKIDIAITTDHGSIKVDDPVKVIGDKATNTNLRYKVGRNLDFNSKKVMAIKNPETVYLPKTSLTASYIFAKESDFLAYPNNYNYYAGYYKNTFQHGGISMQEMIIPLIFLSAK